MLIALNATIFLTSQKPMTFGEWLKFASKRLHEQPIIGVAARSVTTNLPAISRIKESAQ